MSPRRRGSTYSPFGKNPTPPPDEYGMPFHYASVSLLWVYYVVDAPPLAKVLDGSGLAVAEFRDVPVGKGVVSLNFQNYTAHLGVAQGMIDEVEFNIHAYPIARESEVPARHDITLTDYLIGQEQTKTIGGFRLWVPASDTTAVKAGKLTFGERKFHTSFEYAVPTPNSPKIKTWEYTCFDPHYHHRKHKKPGRRDIIYSTKVDLSRLHPTTGHASPLMLYSALPGGPSREPGDRRNRLIGSRWNMLGLYDTYLNLKGARHTMDYGASNHQMRKDMQHIIGGTRPHAARVFRSGPAAIENRAFYID